MLKKTNIKVFILFFSLIFVGFVGTLNLGDDLSVDNHNYSTINEKSLEKSSTYKISSLWNFSTGNIIRDIEISQDGKYIAIGDDSNVTLFNKNNNDTLWSYDMVNTITMDRSIDISIDYGKDIYISVGDSVGNAYLLNHTVATPYYTKKLMWNFSLALGSNMETAISSDGKYIVGANMAGGTEFFLFNNSYQSGNKSSIWSKNFGGPTIKAIDIAYNPYDGHYYIAVGCSDNKLWLFNETKGLIWVNDTTSAIEKVKISYDGEYVIASNSENEVYLFNKTEQNPKKFLWNYTVSQSNIVDIDISGDGQYIMIGTEEFSYLYSTIHYLNNTPSLSKKPIWKVNATEGAGDNTLNFAELSGDGKYILVGTGEVNTAHLYNSSKTTPKSQEWEDLQGKTVFRGAISWYGNYFALNDFTKLYLYHHNVPLPRIISAIIGDDDDDDDDAPAIPFGNYYLIFTAITIISLVVIMKRKANFNKE